MALEKRFVHRNVLHSDDFPFFQIHMQDPVYEKKGVSVRKNILYFSNIKNIGTIVRGHYICLSSFNVLERVLAKATLLEWPDRTATT